MTPRIWITRPEDNSHDFATLLADRACRVIADPVLMIEPYDIPPLSTYGFDALIFTSQVAVRCFAKICRDRKIVAYAVGAKTAESLVKEGFEQIISANGAVTDLASLLQVHYGPHRARFLYVTGEHISGELKETLEDKGYFVERMILYSTKPNKVLMPETLNALNNNDIHIVTFLSARSLWAFRKILENYGMISLCQNMIAVTISAEVLKSRYSDELPWKDVVIAKEPHLKSVVQTIDQLLESGL